MRDGREGGRGGREGRGDSYTYSNTNPIASEYLNIKHVTYYVIT